MFYLLPIILLADAYSCSSKDMGINLLFYSLLGIFGTIFMFSTILFEVVYYFNPTNNTNKLLYAKEEMLFAAAICTTKSITTLLILHHKRNLSSCIFGEGFNFQ